MSINPVLSLPGVSPSRSVFLSPVFLHPDKVQYANLNALISSNSRDVTNSNNNLLHRAGLVMGRHTTSSKWLAALLTIDAPTGTTTLTFPEHVGAELQRRVGTTGSLTRWYVSSGNWTSATVNYTNITFSAGNATVTLSASMPAGDANTANILAFNDVNTELLLPIPDNSGVLCSSANDTQWAHVPVGGVVLVDKLLPTASSAAVRRSFAKYLNFRNGSKVQLMYDKLLSSV